jgi:hypothetical protein
VNFNILGCPAGSIWICVVLRIDRFFRLGDIVAWSFVALAQHSISWKLSCFSVFV